MNDEIDIAVIGGTGLYSMPGLEDIHSLEVDTPFGKPSSPIIVGSLENRRIGFLARHGIGHTLSPTEVNYRANIYAIKKLGAARIISVSAAGSLNEDYAPGNIVVPDQLFDFTKKRTSSFFEGGLVAHVGVADPFCTDLSGHLFQAFDRTGAQIHRGGRFITIEGPRFSTRGESLTFRSWGMSLIGMTTSPEAFLAREAEICYAVMAHVTDYDVWHVSEAPVTVEMVLEIIDKNLTLAQDAIRNLVSDLPKKRNCDCGQALSSALTTHRDAISPEARERLVLLVDRYYQE